MLEGIKTQIDRLIALYEAEKAENEKLRNAHFGTRVRVPYAEALTQLQPLAPEAHSVLEGIAWS